MPPGSPFAPTDRRADPSVHDPRHEWLDVVIDKATVGQQLLELAGRGVDVVINLCDGAWDEARPGVEVVQGLERLGLAYTGADPRFYDPSRLAMKMACHAAGVAFPAFAVATSPADAPRIAGQLRMPLLVKHPQGYGGIGLTADSRVHDTAGLAREIERTVAAYGAALVEEFIDGMEATVLVAEPAEPGDEPCTYPAMRFVFAIPGDFRRFDLKWASEDEVYELVADPALDDRLRDVAARTFAALGGSGFARCDLRVADDGTIYLLEINPNCGVFVPGDFCCADYILARSPGGHRAFLEHLLRCALRRRDRRARSWEIRHDRTLGFGLAATRTIRAGETVVVHEEQPQTIVSRQWVERTWRGVRRQWFDAYAWPISAEIFGMWSDNPEDWRPINHSCDPNVWMTGLDVVARRDISAGEWLTIDYATFCGPNMAPFTCACGARDCRGTIDGDDMRRPELQARYRGHMLAR